MTNPKIKPCPRCGADAVAVYQYDSGTRRAECDMCDYIAPCEGSIRQAIRSHNEKAAAEAIATQKPG